ncbi:hypothetical protein [Pseudonocardia sp. NPDC049635]|uniref:hypothetical protein n=1 Tax=Pseudonocardia sp. NPDC049635 TaxID=3155506 RepID=UPI0033EC9E14
MEQRKHRITSLRGLIERLLDTDAATEEFQYRARILITDLESMVADDTPTTPRAVAIIYTDGDEGDGRALEEAVLAFARQHDVELISADDPIEGSWYHRLWLRTRIIFGSVEAHGVYEQMYGSIIAHLEEKSAQVDSLKSESAAKLIEAVRAQEQAVVLLGRLLIVKFGSRLIVTNISVAHAEKLKTDPMFGEPAEVLKLLFEATESVPKLQLEN